MTQENLKLLAEEMGYLDISFDLKAGVRVMKDDAITWYTPSTNPAQAEELAIHYKIGVYPYIDSDLWEAIPMDFPLTCEGAGKTPSEAITACALEIIKSKQ